MGRPAAHPAAPRGARWHLALHLRSFSPQCLDASGHSSQTCLLPAGQGRSGSTVTDWEAQEERQSRIFRSTSEMPRNDQSLRVPGGTCRGSRAKPTTHGGGNARGRLCASSPPSTADPSHARQILSLVRFELAREEVCSTIAEPIQPADVRIRTKIRRIPDGI